MRVFFSRFVKGCSRHIHRTMSLRVAESCTRSVGSLSRHAVFASFRAFIAPGTRRISSHTIHTFRTRPVSVAWKRARWNDGRRLLQTQRYQSFTPPSPESLGKAAPAREYRRSIKFVRRFLYISATTGLLYLIDTQLYASSITRSLRTFGLGLVVALDYKLNC